MPVLHIVTARDLDNTAENKQQNYVDIDYLRLCYWLKSLNGVTVQLTEVVVLDSYIQ